MTIGYKTNGANTTKSLTEWFFGPKTVRNLTEAAIKTYKTSGKSEYKFWQDNTGYLTIVIH